VDDDPQFGDITKRFLEREDERFSVVAETTAEDGIARLQEGAFDCIVSDYELPDMDGVEFLETVRRDNPTLPFILFTGKGTEDVASRAITAGVTDYLQKQSGIDQYTSLANRIGNAVDRVQALRQSELSHRTMETATEGLSLVKGDGTFLYVNCAFADLFGYDQDELIDTHWSVLCHKKEAERLETHILPAVHETGYWAGETVRLTKGGQRLVTDHRLSHTEEDVIVCTARDLTDDRTSPTEQSTSLDLLLDGSMTASSTHSTTRSTSPGGPTGRRRYSDTPARRYPARTWATCSPTATHTRPARRSYWRRHTRPERSADLEPSCGRLLGKAPSIEGTGLSSDENTCVRAAPADGFSRRHTDLHRQTAVEGHSSEN
jgi:PAS domain S-box-containing protein